MAVVFFPYTRIEIYKCNTIVDIILSNYKNTFVAMLINTTLFTGLHFSLYYWSETINRDVNSVCT